MIRPLSAPQKDVRWVIKEKSPSWCLSKRLCKLIKKKKKKKKKEKKKVKLQPSGGEKKGGKVKGIDFPQPKGKCFRCIISDQPWERGKKNPEHTLTLHTI